jgi:hypothetical protein
MNRHEIHLLQQIRGYPVLTITLPTHRTSPDNRQDLIRVKNLVEQAAVVYSKNSANRLVRRY